MWNVHPASVHGTINVQLVVSQILRVPDLLVTQITLNNLQLGNDTLITWSAVMLLSSLTAPFPCLFTQELRLHCV